MPVMDGFESTKKIQNYQNSVLKDTSKQKCEIVALTAFTNKDNLQRCKDLGMADILHKPANSSKIFETINKYVSSLLQPESQFSDPQTFSQEKSE